MLLADLVALEGEGIGPDEVGAVAGAKLSGDLGGSGEVALVGLLAVLSIDVVEDAIAVEVGGDGRSGHGE